jgi:translation initiation factor 2B subunit (eIF-2B alpha/beta/delta family)
MTATNDRLDRVERLIEQLAETQLQGQQNHDREVAEIRLLQASNARSLEALTNRVSEVSNGVDACIRTIGSMNQVMERLEIGQNEMREQAIVSQQKHDEQMERLGRVLETILTRYPNPPQD